jgi:hypothetical protein
MTDRRSQTSMKMVSICRYACGFAPAYGSVSLGMILLRSEKFGDGIGHHHPLRAAFARLQQDGRGLWLL